MKNHGKKETQQITQKISSSIHLLCLGSRGVHRPPSPTASAAASPATSGADMEQIWREKQLRAKEKSPNFGHGNGNTLPTVLH